MCRKKKLQINFYNCFFATAIFYHLNNGYNHLSRTGLNCCVDHLTQSVANKAIVFNRCSIFIVDKEYYVLRLKALDTIGYSK